MAKAHFENPVHAVSTNVQDKNFKILLCKNKYLISRTLVNSSQAHDDCIDKIADVFTLSHACSCLRNLKSLTHFNFFSTHFEPFLATVFVDCSYVARFERATIGIT